MAQQTSIRIMDILDDDQRATLLALGVPVRFPVGQAVFIEGQPSHSVLIIEHGSLKVTRTVADRTEILAIRSDGEVIGEEGVLMDEVRDGTVTAITEVSGLDIAADQLLSFVEEEHLWPVMYRAAVRRRRQSDNWTLLARMDVKTRLARWLIAIAAEVGQDVEDGLLIESALSQQDIANRIGASRDAVAIEFRSLRTAKLVSTGRGRIVLHDLEALRQRSQF